MPKVRIDWNTSAVVGAIYTATDPAFAWVSKANKDGVRRQVSDFMTCRESFADHLRMQIQNGNIEVPKNRLAFLFGKAISYDAPKHTKELFQKTFFGNTKRGIRILNILESHLGWPRSRMFATNLGDSKRHQAAFLITGPAKWMRAPHLLSLYCLILRCGRFPQFDNANTVRGIFMIINRITKKNLGPSNASGDRAWLRQTAKFWLPVLENMEELYKGRTLIRNYHRRHLEDDNGFHEGILRLANGKTKDIQLRERWRLVQSQLRKKG